MNNNYLKPVKEIFDLKKGFRVITGLWEGKLCHRVVKDGSHVDTFPCVDFSLDIAGNVAIIKQKGGWP